jgi:hypothetical protein
MNCVSPRMLSALLINTWSRILLKKLTFHHIEKNFPTFYGKRIFIIAFFFPVSKQTKSGLDRLTGEAPRTHRNTDSIGHPWTSDQLVAEASTYTTQKHRWKNIMPSARFETAIPAIKVLQNDALDNTVHGQIRISKMSPKSHRNRALFIEFYNLLYSYIKSLLYPISTPQLQYPLLFACD